MEPTEAEVATKKQLRLVLVLGKFRVLERENLQMKIALGGSTTMTVTLPPQADVKAGDILTFYTEVLYAEPKPPSVQRGYRIHSAPVSSSSNPKREWMLDMGRPSIY